jgi:hypothetical protein
VSYWLHGWFLQLAGRKCIQYHHLNPPKMVAEIVHYIPLNLSYSKRWVSLCMLHRQHIILQLWCHVSVLHVLV